MCDGLTKVVPSNLHGGVRAQRAGITWAVLCSRLTVVAINNPNMPTRYDLRTAQNFANGAWSRFGSPGRHKDS
jgi:hypothetical protein